VIRWNHFQATVPLKFVTDDGAPQSELESSIQVFQRGLNELKLSALDDVISMCKPKDEGKTKPREEQEQDSNYIYRGTENLDVLNTFKACLREWNKLKEKHSSNSRALDVFLFSTFFGPRKFAMRMLNTSIGTLVKDFSEGILSIDDAVKSYETKVAPLNYRRSNSVVTPQMAKEAKKVLKDLGYEESLERRHATLSDISIQNVRWVGDAFKHNLKGQVEKALDILGSSRGSSATRKGNAQEISIEDFMSNILPKARGMELLLKNDHERNFVSLTAPVHEGSKNLFKWDNNFAWSYEGNATDTIRDMVKKAGGNVDDADMRVSLSWFNNDDLDLHCEGPGNLNIYYASPTNREGELVLDVDMNGLGGMSKTRTPVENMSFRKLSRYKEGLYLFEVHNFNRRESIDVGFNVEVATRTGSQFFSFRGNVPHKALIQLFEIRVLKGEVAGVQVLSDQLKSVSHVSGPSKDKWGLTTETLVPVRTVLNSPNHWDDNEVGNKHTFFILDGCKNPNPTRGFYNEFLSSDLVKHRKVFETLGDLLKCPVTEDQLSGVGFSSTLSDTVTVCVDSGSAKKFYTIKF